MDPISRKRKQVRLVSDSFIFAPFVEIILIFDYLELKTEIAFKLIKLCNRAKYGLSKIRFTKIIEYFMENLKKSKALLGTENSALNKEKGDAVN